MDFLKSIKGDPLGRQGVESLRGGEGSPPPAPLNPPLTCMVPGLKFTPYLGQLIDEFDHRSLLNFSEAELLSVNWLKVSMFEFDFVFFCSFSIFVLIEFGLNYIDLVASCCLIC